MNSLVHLSTEWHLLNSQFGQDTLGEIYIHIMKSKSKRLNERLIN